MPLSLDYLSLDSRDLPPSRGFAAGNALIETRQRGEN
jgi:hypothetical protein